MQPDPALEFARQSLMSYACLQWSGYEPAAHHHLIAQYLEKVERGEIKRLIIQSPPRSGKSMIVSTYFPAWYMGKNPDKRVVCASYGQELASDFGRAVRNQFSDTLFQQIFPGVRLAEDSAAADKFELAPPRRGGYVAVGVGGALTGRGAHCFVAGTLVQTNCGEIPIERLMFAPRPVKILSFNERESILEYQDIEAFSSRSGFGIYRITTSSGRMVEVTGDHPIFVRGKGYVPAAELTSGDFVMRLLQERVCQAILCGSEKHTTRAPRQLLFAGLLSVASRSKKLSSLQSLWDSSREKGKKILCWLSSKASRKKSRTSADKGKMPYLQYRIYGGKPLWRKICGILHEKMLGDWAFNKNEWKREPALDSWIGAGSGATVLCKSISRNAPIGISKRSTFLRFLRGDQQKIARSPFGWESDEQCSGKSSDIMRSASQENSCGNGFWAGYDNVESIVRVREEATVYDIQVKTNHNLFANGLLCHNCLLIDDPIKGREDGDSEAHQRRLKDWYTAVAYTRLMDEGSIIICQTRWNINDLAGWVIKEHKHENWVILNLPAINEKGEALWPERFPLRVLHGIKKTLPSRDWEALYQQKPFAEEGNIYKRDWWKRWPENKPLPECSFILVSFDTAFSDAERKKSSYSACVVLGVFKRPDDECHQILLIDSWKKRLEYPDLRKEVRRMYQDHSPDKMIIEKKASGISIIQDLRRGGIPLSTYTPERDKITRAYAASGLLESGLIYCPTRRWADEFISSLARFPNPEDDDVADAFSQAVIFLQNGLLVAHAEDAARRASEDEDEEDIYADESLSGNVRRLKPKKKRAAYG